MKITELEIRSYRGVRATKVRVGAAGAIVKGRNASGKTSILKAIGAALAAQDIGPDAVRVGEDKAEIIVNLDALRVRRSITAKTSTLTVSSPDGATYPKPQTRLNEMLGTCALDPLALFLAADSAERRTLVLEAVHLRVTEEQVRRWTAGADLTDVMLDGLGHEDAHRVHGLVALERLRKVFYDRRTHANAEAKAARARAEAADVVDVPNAPPLADAEHALREADRDMERLQIAHARAEGAAKASAATRERASALRAKAAKLLEDAPAPHTGPEREDALNNWTKASSFVEELQTKLRAAEQEREKRGKELFALNERDAAATKAVDEATRLMTEADETDASVAVVNGVSEGAMADATAALERARADKARAEVASSAAKTNAAFAALHDAAAAAAERAKALDAIVETLTKDAPVELAQSPEMIPGLGFSEAGITLDGVAIDHLSGAEQMRFAIDVARRANARAKILVVDGLERLDTAGMNDFVRYATRDGFQLIGTRVADGEMVIEAIETEDETQEGSAA